MPTIGEMIEQHQELKKHVERETEAFSAAIKPYSDAMAILEQALLAELEREFPGPGPKRFSCEHGTAYKSVTMSAKVEDREKFLDFVWDGHIDFLDSRVLKGPVEEWIDTYKKPPPGVTVGYNAKCNIRKS